jgi:hypothetical protein
MTLYAKDPYIWFVAAYSISVVYQFEGGKMLEGSSVFNIFYLGISLLYFPCT